jgi:hypothetical protein
VFLFGPLGGSAVNKLLLDLRLSAKIHDKFLPSHVSILDLGFESALICANLRQKGFWLTAVC